MKSEYLIAVLRLSESVSIHIESTEGSPAMLLQHLFFDRLSTLYTRHVKTTSSTSEVEKEARGSNSSSASRGRLAPKEEATTHPAEHVGFRRRRWCLTCSFTRCHIINVFGQLYATCDSEREPNETPDAGHRSKLHEQKILRCVAEAAPTTENDGLLASSA